MEIKQNPFKLCYNEGFLAFKKGENVLQAQRKGWGCVALGHNVVKISSLFPPLC